MSSQRKSRGKHRAVSGSKDHATDRHREKADALAQPNKVSSNWVPYLNQLLPLVLIIVLTLAAYANAWPNNLVYDDNLFENSGRYSDLSNVPRYFTENAWASEGFNTNLYRPLMLASISLDARMYGEWVAGYHLTNICLHLLVTLLVYVFLLQLLRMTDGESSSPRLFALLATLVFAVHPIHAEAVNSIFNRSELLVALGGLAGLSWFLRHQVSRPIRAWTGLGLAYLAVLFCKESGAVLPGLAVSLVVILTPGDWRVRVKKSLPAFMLLVPLILYLTLRSQALETVGAAGASDLPSSAHLSGVSNTLDAIQLPEWKRLLMAAGIWYESFKVMLWPYPLRIYYERLPALEQSIGLAVHLALISLALILARRKHFGLILGLAFFYIAMLPASRIIGDQFLYPHLNERYLYFPSVGPAITLAFGLRFLARRLDVKMSAAIAALALVVMMPVTWARNASWASEIKLFESEYQNGNQMQDVLRLLTAAYLEGDDFQKAADVCDRHGDVQKRYGVLSVHCAAAYGRIDRHEDAVSAYLFATTQSKSRTVAHENLAKYYIRQGQWQNAKRHFELAARTESDPAMKAFRQGYMLTQLYPRNRAMLLQAKAQFETALRLQPNLPNARKWLTRVNKRLGTL
jgi:tetratricopeptide (TPR) repeat protein